MCYINYSFFDSLEDEMTAVIVLAILFAIATAGAIGILLGDFLSKRIKQRINDDKINTIRKVRTKNPEVEANIAENIKNLQQLVQKNPEEEIRNAYVAALARLIDYETILRQIDRTLSLYEKTPEPEKKTVFELLINQYERLIETQINTEFAMALVKAISRQHTKD